MAMMKTIKVKVSKGKNWAGNEYLVYSTEKHGKIAELDYADSLHELPRVYCVADNNTLTTDYVSFSSVTQALVGAETVCTGWLLDRGYFAEYVYPKTIRMR